MRRTIPTPVRLVVGDVLGQHLYSHNAINALFAEAGAPGEPPVGNCILKCQTWLARSNDDRAVDPMRVLGRVLEKFMEWPIDESSAHLLDRDRDWLSARTRVSRVLADNGLAYHSGGIVTGTTASPARSLEQRLRAHDFVAVEDEFRIALESVDANPRSALTAACAIIESICKVYIDDSNGRLQRPTKQELAALWKVVRDDLGLDPKNHLGDQDVVAVLSGLGAVVTGLGAYRTHEGSAHGRGRDRPEPKPRHARLAINAAHTIVNFLIETWNARRPSGSGSAE